jgi:Tol biopolymer transport system component
VLHLVNLQTGKLEPAYSPDGSKIAYVMEGRSGADGAPGIWLYDVKTGNARLLAAGFRAPSWSPDGKYMAATRVSGSRLDVVVLDSATGQQVAQVTYDGFSWAPVWSPAGDELVYMHLSSTVVDLDMTHVRSGTAFEFRMEPDLTEHSSLDGSSRAAGYVPVGGNASAS